MLALLAAALPTAACTWVEAPAWPRPPLPLPDAVALRYELPARPECPEPAAPDPNGVEHGELRCGTEQVRYHLHRCPERARGLVLLVPILAGGEQLMNTVATRLVARGFHVGWCNRVAAALSPPQRGPELESLFRRTVLHQRALLDWLCARPGFEDLPVFALGISMGGMVSTVLTAVEPRIRAAAICLAGADLPGIVLDTAEHRVQRWVHWRTATDAIGRSSLQQELERYLTSDPLRLAPYVAADRVLLVSASLDEVVTGPHQDLLWEALGRPRRLSVPFGHYSAALALDAIVASAARFYADRAGAAEVPATRPARP